MWVVVLFGSIVRLVCDSVEVYKVRLGVFRIFLRLGFNVEEKFFWICKFRFG